MIKQGTRFYINSDRYRNAYYQWKKEEGNKDKDSNAFDKEIGIGAWKPNTSVLVKNEKLLLLAILKYNI